MGFAIEVLPIGPVSVGARAWRHHSRHLLTAIVKATFALVPDGPMSIVPPLPLVDEERHHRNNPVASLTHASDLALLVPRPEVVVVGSACAAPGQTVTQLSVRLAVQRDSAILINKRLDVIGDRRVRPGAAADPPTPFSKMPIVYERALGGMTNRDNPVGVGLEPDPDGLMTLPNITGAANTPVPHGLGPIPSAWPIRAKRRGSLSWTLANLSPDVEVPDDFDDGYFQTAPADQQTADLRSGDLIALVNMHPEHGMLRTTLPAGHAVALAQTATGERLSLQLRIDTVHLEPEALRAEIIYRGAIVLDLEEPFDMRVAGAFETPDRPFVFPDLYSVAGLVARTSQHNITTGPSLESTEVFEGPTPGTLAQRHSGTFVMEPAVERPAPDNVELPPLPAPAVPAPTFGPPPSALRAATSTYEPPPPFAPPALQALEPPPPPKPVTMLIEPEPPRERPTTMVLEPEAPHAKSLPFTHEPREPSPSSPGLEPEMLEISGPHVSTGTLEITLRPEAANPMFDTSTTLESGPQSLPDTPLSSEPITQPRVNIEVLDAVAPSDVARDQPLELREERTENAVFIPEIVEGPTLVEEVTEPSREEREEREEPDAPAALPPPPEPFKAPPPRPGRSNIQSRLYRKLKR
ncbi:MAG: DUF2169 domain-containing protein [Polyangiaceae bacterium]